MARSPSPTELALAAAALDRLRPGVDPATAARLRSADWSAGEVEEGGQFHRVLVLEGTGVLRMARAHEAGALPAARWDPGRDPSVQLPRRMALLDGLAAIGLPWAVPAPLSEVVGGGPGGTRAVLQPHIPGSPHPPHEGDPAALRAVVDALAAVDVGDPRLAPHLGEPSAFRGPWTPERAAAVAALPGRVAERLGGWPGDAAPRADAPAAPVGVDAARWPAVVAALVEAAVRWTAEPPVPAGLVHGDLGGHNLRWLPGPEDGDGGAVPTRRLAGVLDWDLACAWDPALNVAHLCLWHGEDLVEQVARDAAEAGRARVWLGVMALEALGDAVARDRAVGLASRSWRRLLRKTLPRVARAVEAVAVGAL